MARQLFHRIIAAVNGSESSIHAAMYGVALAKTCRLDLKIVYVVDTAALRQLTLSKFFTDSERAMYEANLCADGDRYLTYIGDMALAKGVQPERELLKGAVWAEVVKAADAFNADMILVGGGDDKEFRGGAGDRRASQSSSRSEIIARAHCSVLAVKQKNIEEIFKAL